MGIVKKGKKIKDATAVPIDVASGKVFYNNDGRQVGSGLVISEKNFTVTDADTQKYVYNTTETSIKTYAAFNNSRTPNAYYYNDGRTNTVDLSYSGGYAYEKHTNCLLASLELNMKLTDFGLITINGYSTTNKVKVSLSLRKQDIGDYSFTVSFLNAIKITSSSDYAVWFYFYLNETKDMIKRIELRSNGYGLYGNIDINVKGVF